MAEIGIEAEFAIEEPSLRYHRLENDCPSCYETNEINRFAAHYKFIVLGHRNGAVNIFDHLGHRVQNGSYRKHFRPVNELSISEDGNFVASCADDGFVYIYNLMEPEESELINLSKPVKSIAISPKYSMTKKIIIADKNISLYSRGIFGRRKPEQLYAPPGGVEVMSWRGDFLIWADEYAVRVYNVRRKQLINFIPKVKTSYSALECRPSYYLSWHSDTCFLIGWEKTVQVCHIVTPSSNDQSTSRDILWTSTTSNDDTESVASNSTLNSTSIISSVLGFREFVQLTVQFSLQRGDDDEGSGEIIYGIASHQGRILALLYSPKSFESLLDVQEMTHDTEELLNVGKSPQLVVLDIGEALTAAPCPIMNDLDSMLDVSEEDSFEEISREDVEVKIPPGSHGLGLATISGDDTHFVYSPTDLICAQSLSSDDRIDWFLDQGIPRRALQIAREHQNDLVKHSPKKLGMDCLNKLLEEKNYALAAGICNLILTDKESWEEQIYRFLHLGQVHVLVPFLPSNKGLINPSTYLVILIDLLNKSPRMFLQKLNDWPPSLGLYPIDPLIAAVQEKTAPFSKQDIFAIAKQDQDVHALFRSLILLYENSDVPEKGLEFSIKLRDLGVFDLLRRHLLPQDQTNGRFSTVVRRQIIPLFQIDTPRATSLMIDCIHELPVEFVVQELESQPQILFKYLDALHMRNPRPALPYIHRLVKLYASYGREQLLPFLRSTHHYPLNEALELCKSLNYIPETVYLLTRVGRRKDALKLLMEKGADDDFLLGNRQLTPEQRQAEVAVQAIAYCLEEDTSHNSEAVAYFNSYDYPRRLHSIRHHQKVSLGSETSSLDSDENSDAESQYNKGKDEDEDVGGLQPHSFPISRETGELWRQVVLFAVDKPGFICALLKHASTEKIDPALLLRKITPNMQIPNLKESLTNLLRNTQMQIELRKNCEAILLKDLQEVSVRLVQIQNRGIFVDAGQRQAGKHVSFIGSSIGDHGVCKVCRQSLLSTVQSFGPSTSTTASELKGVGQLQQPPLVVFRCSHVFHRSCIFKRSPGRIALSCPVCIQQHVPPAAS
ncbi:unnamed protein product [Rodentolepis nana]|uniref:RING-type domain-containing protein n=1 Tax=Rodentolepis nana TaxID=102285 RepID=A0A0R3TL86_RODNA|nr:unnamed protein product [Rodentolepis nana]